MDKKSKFNADLYRRYIIAVSSLSEITNHSCFKSKKIAREALRKITTK